MEKDKKEKRFQLNKKVIIILGVVFVFIVCFFVINLLGGFKISGNAQGAENGDSKTGNVQSETPAPAPVQGPPASSGSGGVGSPPVTNTNPEVAPAAQRPVITAEQKNLINQAVLSSPFAKDLPNNGVIALRFYDFYLGERIWQPDILIGKTGILTSGTPDITLFMHARYISQLNGANLCDVIKSAQTNGEMWTETSESTLKLLMKYSGMMKYRDCLGF
jgi:hypothetical protein